MKTKQKLPPYGLCLDWETSGADFGKDSSKRYQGLTFGAIVFNTSNFKPITELYREIKFNSGTVKNDFEWTEEAFKIHGKSREYLDKHGVTQEDAATDLLELIVNHWGTNDFKIMFLGHNPHFDIRFTAQLMREIGVEFSIERDHPELNIWIQLHHVVLDTSALGMITLGLFKSDLLFDKIGFSRRLSHNALEDARLTLQTCQILRNVTEIGLYG